MALSFSAFGQQKGKVYYFDNDTLKGADTVYFNLSLTGYYSLSWEFYFKQIGGTSDGTGILQATNDTSYITINNVDGVISAYPNDTITIVDGLSAMYWLYGTPANNYKMQFIGTLGDTTAIISNYVIKR
jgi:hypothetical protein